MTEQTSTQQDDAAIHRRAISDVLSLFYAADLGETDPPETDAGTIKLGEMRTIRREIRELNARITTLETERDEARRIASDINRGAVRLHDILRVTLASVRTLIDPALHTPDRIRRYLAAQGWTHVRDTATGSDWTWGTPVAEWASVPGSTHYSDYARRIAIIVVDAADVHGTGELRVLADIQEIDSEPMPNWLTAAVPSGAEEANEGE